MKRGVAIRYHSKAMRNDVQDIIDVYQNIFISLNAGKWDSWKESFLEEVDVDYSSLTGQPCHKVQRDVWLEEFWKVGFKKYPILMHFLSNHVVKVAGDAADASCYAMALHVVPGTPGGDSLTAYGIFEFHLIRTARGWKVSAIKLTIKYQTGNLAIYAAKPQP